MYPYGLIGNCQTASLINKNGTIEWLCLPRPDSPPVFGSMLDKDGGYFSILPAGNYKSTQRYVPNTNVLVTTFSCEDGTLFEITDFCPRFEEHGRMYRPMALFRIVEPKKGLPTIKVSCIPVNGWEKECVPPTRGNSHIAFEIRGDVLRLATNMSLTYLIEESPLFTLNEKIYLVFSK